MIIHVKAKPDGYEEKIEKIDAIHFIVETREPPVNNRANRSITKIVGQYFGVEPGKVRLIKGHRESSKIFDIGER
jgi:uncharacterized protein YggU (UPF0235/DUF167 family)